MIGATVQGENEMFYADLHVHGMYSSAASPKMTLPEIGKVARQKGISVMGTGDCFHPVWMGWIEALEEDPNTGLLNHEGSSVRFLPTVEVSCEKGRKRMHMLLFFPDGQMVHKIRMRLEKYGNLDKDGRPALKLLPGELMDVVKSKFDDVIVVAAHILTPHTGILGDRNHYESIYDVMDVLPDAIETGLSADKGAVRSIGELKKTPLLSFSDAHSLPNIGREVTKFEGEISWKNIAESIRTGKIDTIEYPPALGKYHYSGHKKCEHSVGAGGRPVCPKCFKRITMGVEQRVEDLKDTEVNLKETYMIPLIHLIGVLVNDQHNSPKVAEIYNGIVASYPEIPILVDRDLRTLPIEFKTKIPKDGLREMITLMRDGQLGIIPGYDGQFGKVVNLHDMMVKKLDESNNLFMSNTDHAVAWNKAERINELMVSDRMVITQEEYETLHK